MNDEWLTYEEAARALGVTPRAARMRAFRGRWARTKGNDGLARVRLPDERPARPQGTRDRTVQVHDSALVTALQAHNETLKDDIKALKEQLAAAEARIEKLTAELSDDRTKADRTLADLLAQLAAEKAMTAKAIEAFSALADRLDALAAANQRRPWWDRVKRRLGG